jgi:integrase/recombinase XerD
MPTFLTKYKDNPRSIAGGTIAKMVGVKKKLTFGVARHTFATTITLSNNVPIETVSKMMGHTKIATTQIYARAQTLIATVKFDIPI